MRAIPRSGPDVEHVLPPPSSVLIVSPALADANNGNWHTASRWARMLQKHCRIGIAQHWDGEPCDLVIALHARRSATSIAAWARAHPQRPLVVVLTGTDLYRDIRNDAGAQRSLQQATHLVVLQEQACSSSTCPARECSVIYQSAEARPVDPPRRVCASSMWPPARREGPGDVHARAVRLSHRATCASSRSAPRSTLASRPRPSAPPPRARPIAGSARSHPHRLASASAAPICSPTAA